MRRIFKKRFSMTETIGFLVLSVLSVTTAGYAATTVPNTFTTGTTAKAAEVNANFSALATAIDSIPAPDTANQVRDKFFTGTSCIGTSANDVMVKVGPLCVDKYEASVWSVFDGTGTAYGVFTGQTAYPGTFPANGNWTTAVYAVSEPGVLPSTSVTWFQAQQACALSGKRLLTNAEWQMAAAGTPDPGTDNGTTDCVVSSAGPANTGARSSCVSNWGVNDMVGNVWEWVADWMQGNTNPWAPSTGTAGASYGADWMYCTNPATAQGAGSTNFPTALIRGGYWGNDSDAGVFALIADNGPSHSSFNIGFRCAR
ncbi:MAG: SUMF1/EgtB/PvdO family nonheme iron enzyme [Nitrospirae bacterium]|nr:SUMF1/EgtB/PvdO family nonheme iron enzyme [Nitrospirota bacterium]